MGSDLDEVAAFCAHQHSRLIGLLGLHVGDREVAEELAQDVLAKVCQHWPRLEDPRAWMNRVAINHANSWLRRRAAERRAMARRKGQQVQEPPTDQADAVAVREAVARLPRRQRTALVYRYYAGLSVTETAEAMSCAPGTVRALTSQAVSGLRDRADLQPTSEEVRHAR